MDQSLNRANAANRTDALEGLLRTPGQPAVRPPPFQDWRQTPRGQQHLREREERERAQRPASPRHRP
eukprot:944069-Alexandrium_andersonii.AAC.1